MEKPAGATRTTGDTPAPGDVGSLLALARGMLRLVGAVRRATGAKLPTAIMYLVLGTLGEGASILLLVPILQTAGAAGGETLPLPDLPFLGGADALAIGLEPLLLALVGLVALQAWFARRRATYFADLLQRFSNDIRASLFRAVADARWDALARMRIGSIEFALTGEIERLNQSVFAVLGMLQSLVGLLLLLGLSAAVSPGMTLLALACGAAALAAMGPFRRASSIFGAAVARRRTDQFGIVTGFLRGLKTARSMNEEPRHVAAFEESLARTRAEAVAHSRRLATGNGLFRVGLAAGAVLFVWIGLEVAGLTVGALLVMLLVLVRVAPRFLALQAQASLFLANETAYGDVRAHLARLETVRERARDAGTRPVPRPRREILVDHVSYHHAQGGESRETPPGLSDVTIRLPVGEAVAVIGASGAGKSTLADIVTGLIAPATGALRIDGEAVASDQARAWRERIAYVPQETALRHGTIRENLLAGAPEADDSRLLRALQDAAAADFVRALPDGLDSPVGDAGTLLSGGERQRIALARALLREPDLLVLDEATSALDWESQARVGAALRALRGRTTILTIAHRPSMAAFADRVYTLDAGRVVEEGTPTDLARDAQSRYARMLAHETGGVG
ncbi:ABC transporter permease [Salinarimonas ramus]|uniref:ABC transporter permease n=2 Tax=Salinarimonas ramus TaxID=690164 RepID=A0A917V4T4_9HYPH|nr:ABC transporter permease [Salinarimonas ramus]